MKFKFLLFLSFLLRLENVFTAGNHPQGSQSDSIEVRNIGIHQCQFTTWFSALSQVLNSYKEVRKFFIESQNLQTSEAWLSLHNFFSLLNNPNIKKAIRISDTLSQVRNWYNSPEGNVHVDIIDFCDSLLNNLIDVVAFLPNGDPYSFIHDTFFFNTVPTFICNTCNERFTKDSANNCFLSFSRKSYEENSDLVEKIKDVKKEKLFCKKCLTERWCFSFNEIKKIPKILILDVFSIKSENIKKTCPKDVIKIDSYNYKLFAIIPKDMQYQQSAYIKSGEKWYEFNGENIIEKSVQYFDDSYRSMVFFYERIDVVKVKKEEKVVGVDTA